MIKIALSGKMGSGKNTVAELLAVEMKNYYRFNYERVLEKDDIYISAFADKIKQLGDLFFPGYNRSFYGNSELRSTIIPGYKDDTKNDLTIRRVLTDIGKLGRSYNPDFWVKSFFQDFFALESIPMLAIISDLRFPNEMKFCKDNGFILVRIKKSQKQLTLLNRIKSIFSKKDISETALDHIPDSDFDYVILNDKDIDALHEKVALFLKVLLNENC